MFTSGWRPLVYRTFPSRNLSIFWKRTHIRRCVTSWSGSRRTFQFDVVWTGFSSYFSIFSHRTHELCVEMDNFQDPQVRLRTFSPSQMCWPNAYVFFLPASKPYTFGKFSFCSMSVEWHDLYSHDRTWTSVSNYKVSLCPLCDTVVLSFPDSIDLIYPT